MRLAARGRSGVGRAAGPCMGWIPATVLAGALASGCGSPGQDSVPPQQRYELAGEVVAVDPEGGTLTIAHAAVTDYMEAMTMPFNVRDDWVFETAERGARIRAELVVDATTSWLEGVVITKSPAAGAAAEAVIPSAKPGDAVPATALVNQDGQAVTLQEYRGRHLLFTFIYTRCPLPDYCPRISEHFDRIHKAVEAEPARYGDPHMLSISVDPAYDTPRVLREYGLRYLGPQAPDSFARWEFARAEPGPLRRLAEFVGLRFMPDRGEIVHSLRTVVADPEGKVLKVYIGNTWTPEELLEELERSVGGALEVTG